MSLDRIEGKAKELKGGDAKQSVGRSNSLRTSFS